MRQVGVVAPFVYNAILMSVQNKKQQIAVGISGGVDSAVALHLLLEQGCDVIPVFMKNWDEEDDEHCAASEDLESAQAVCDHLGVPLKTVNFSYEYWEHVFTQFVAGYRAGYTPNPDTLCNREIKFKTFLDFALDLGAGRIATGHYAGIEHASNDDIPRRLLRGHDPNKDQSYFLYLLDQHALRRTVFPLAGMLKKEVRQTAKAMNLPCHGRKDSTGICFVGEKNLYPFLSKYIPSEAGDIVDESGHCVGRHHGAAFYTIGQRTGLGIGGRKDGNGQPWYVVAKDIDANRITVVQGHDHPALFVRNIVINEPHWIAGAPDDNMSLTARCRYRQPDKACRLTPRDDGLWNVHFVEPQWATAPGQAVVFYHKQYCLGGATIAPFNTDL